MYDKPYDLDYETSTYLTDSVLHFMAGVFGILFIVFIIGYIIQSWLHLKIFEKAGIEKWKAWVPFYREWIFLELGGYNGAISLIALATSIPYIGFISSIALFIFFCLSANEISKKLGKENLFILYPLGLATLGLTTLLWYIFVPSKETIWNDSLGKPSLAKGTIIGYAVVDEESEVETF